MESCKERMRGKDSVRATFMSPTAQLLNSPKSPHGDPCNEITSASFPSHQVLLALSQDSLSHGRRKAASV